MVFKKIRYGLAGVILLIGAGLSEVKAQSENEVGCSIYAKIGGIVVDFMLPLTVQDLVNVMQGKDPALLNQLTSTMLSDLGSEDLLEMVKLNESDQDLLGEAAGQGAFQLLLSGQVSNGFEVRGKLLQTCHAIGFQQILANQQAANEAVSRNIQQ